MKTGVIFVAIIISFFGLFIVNNPELFNKKVAKANPAPIQNTDESSPKVKTDNRWFVIENITGKCRLDEGPAKMIKNLKKLGQPYNVIDEDVVDDKPLRVKLLLNDGYESGQIVYYRGLKRCQDQAAINKQASDLELDRYK